MTEEYTGNIVSFHDEYHVVVVDNMEFMLPAPMYHRTRIMCKVGYAVKVEYDTGTEIARNVVVISHGEKYQTYLP